VQKDGAKEAAQSEFHRLVAVLRKSA